ncbi:RNA-binding protein [Bartonella sp. TP]|uniref:RNA-binding protein n=1 Tax=Bartonella sp. TP TaxID=3057550 RepID=UPI0025B1110A|nr:RNA-binding protein [Bartonella sp. TP]MDN5248560.1 RNA-binding protein [Alphaproteobacteria bacterium]WJW80398.1 RNA-binding protein [Bartonella sp. TP]
MNKRTCIVTRKEHEAEAMLRFVLAPNGSVVPDLKRILPGRGVYTLARKTLVNQAVTNNMLTRSFIAKSQNKALQIAVPKDMAEQIEHLLRKQSLANLAIGRKAGAVISGSLACDKAIRSDNVAMVLHRIDAAEDGINKITQAIHSLGPEKKATIKQYIIFNENELSTAFGERNAVHIAVLKHPMAKNILNTIDKLHIYRE